MPKLIAITGNIGSGKSTAARVLEQFGAVRIDADQLARQVVAPGTPALQEIVAMWGQGVLLPDGSLDRAQVGRIVFADPAAKQKLEAITHPRIRDAMFQAIANALARNPPLVVVEVPLLFEGGMDKQFPGVLLIAADEQVRLARVMTRDHVSAAEAGDRLRSQMPQEQKIARARWVVTNNGDEAALTQALQNLWTELTAPAQGMVS